MKTLLVLFSLLVMLNGTAWSAELATGKQISAAVSGSTVQGKMINGGTYNEFYRNDGIIVGKDYGGKWRINGNEMCFLYQSEPATPESCWQVRLDGDQVTWVKDGKVDGTGTILKGNPNGFAFGTRAEGVIEFAVNKKFGSSFGIAGYASDRTLIFKEVASVSEVRNDGTYFVFRIGEEKLRNKTLTEWCMEWKGEQSFLSAEMPKVILCDENPIESQGSYSFGSGRMRHKDSLPGSKLNSRGEHEIAVLLNKDANFEAAALKGKKVLWKSGKMGGKTKRFTAQIPEARAKAANTFCVYLAKGWIVKDAAGKPYQASCNEFPSLIGTTAYILNIEKR